MLLLTSCSHNSKYNELRLRQTTGSLSYEHGCAEPRRVSPYLLLAVVLKQGDSADAGCFTVHTWATSGCRVGPHTAIGFLIAALASNTDRLPTRTMWCGVDATAAGTSGFSIKLAKKPSMPFTCSKEFTKRAEDEDRYGRHSPIVFDSRGALCAD
jgi:hypothetical protein